MEEKLLTKGMLSGNIFERIAENRENGKNFCEK